MGKSLHQRLKLSHHQHSGKVLPHGHTSHGVLLVLLIAAGLMMWFATDKALAGNQTGSGSVAVSGVVPSPAPEEPPVVETPEPTPEKPTVEIRGTKPTSGVIEVYSNGILVGIAGCKPDKFALDITPLRGKNEIKTRIVDSLGQYSPDSIPFSFNYLPLLSVQRANVPQLFITTEAAYYGIQVGQAFDLKPKITGGKGPYAVSSNWGDGSSDDLVVRTEPGQFSQTHNFENPGCYLVQVNVKDSVENEAYFQTVVIVSGSKEAVASTSKIDQIIATPTLGFLWPLYLMVLGIIAAFWLGEKYQLRRDKDLWKSPKLKY